MKHRFAFLALPVLCGAVLLSVGSAADEKKPPTAEDKARREAQAEDARLLAEAARLAEIGQKYKSPEALIAAGTLVRRVNARTEGKFGQLTAKVTVLDEKGNPVPNARIETVKTTSLDDLASGYFDAASALAIELKTSKEVDALIRAAKTRTFEGRGAYGGPQLVTRVLGPHESHRYEFEFDEHSLAAVGFEATGNCRWELRNGEHRLFELTSFNGQYGWVPEREHRGRHYEFTVRNEERRPVTYRLATN
jgi:hypothetical protein